MNTLAIDVGGSHVKIRLSGDGERRAVNSGPEMTPTQMVSAVKELAAGWTWDQVTVGLPSVVRDDRVVLEPVHLGPGWVHFDFGAAFDCPVRVVNDAAMQALGSYQGGTMLFLGLGTGLGSAMVADGVLLPMELGHLPYRKDRTYEEYLGESGRKRMGASKWERHVWHVVAILRAALQPTDLVIGGGNAKRLDAVPDGVRRGDNLNAFVGAFRLWQSLDERSTG
jgi:predicted NBD/HSP70 family sugar kinase